MIIHELPFSREAYAALKDGVDGLNEENEKLSTDLEARYEHYTACYPCF
jgi:hypothetical protein